MTLKQNLKAKSFRVAKILREKLLQISNVWNFVSCNSYTNCLITVSHFKCFFICLFEKKKQKKNKWKIFNLKI